MKTLTLTFALLMSSFSGTPAMAKDTKQGTPTPNLIDRLLAEQSDKFSTFTDDPKQYKLQILLSVIDDADPDHPRLTRHGYRLEEEYFYPASSIKTFASAAALIRLQGIREETGLPIQHDTPIVIHPLFDDEKLQDHDDSNVDTGKITIEHEIRKTLLVSSNSAYNHLFEFVGHEHLHLILRHAGMPDVRLNHRLSEFRSRQDNRRSPRIDFTLDDGTVYTVPQRTSQLITDNDGLNGLTIGDGYMKHGQLVNAPLDFRFKNHTSLKDLQDFLIKVVRPNIDLGTPALPLSQSDRTILLSALSQHPYDSRNPVYTEKDVSPDHIYPPFQPGIERLVPRDNLLIYAKGGEAYGFKTANALIIHKPTGNSFALAATLYVNPDRILNNDNYDYHQAERFLADLGEAVAQALWKTN